MSRITDAIITDAYAKNAGVPVLDVSKGGQQGYAPSLGYYNASKGQMEGEWISNQAYVQRNVNCILLEAPKFFSLLPNGQKWVAALKAMVEVHTLTISGLDSKVTMDFAEHAVGGAGEMQEEVINATRARSTPTHTMTEKIGMPFYRILNFWCLYGLMDPETNAPLISSVPGLTVDPKDMLADMFTATMLYYEPDITNTRVNKSWICTNMMPKDDGEFTGKRDLTSALELDDKSIEFTSITQSNIGTNVFAQSIIDGIDFKNANPYMRKAFIDKVSPDVLAATSGFKNSVSNISGTQV